MFLLRQDFLIYYIFKKNSIFINFIQYHKQITLPTIGVNVNTTLIEVYVQITIFSKIHTSNPIPFL